MVLRVIGRVALMAITILGCATIITSSSYSANTKASRVDDLSSFEISNEHYTPSGSTNAATMQQTIPTTVDSASGDYVQNGVVRDPVIPLNRAYSAQTPQPAVFDSNGTQNESRQYQSSSVISPAQASAYQQPSSDKASRYSRDYAVQQVAQASMYNQQNVPQSLESGAEQFSVAADNETPPVTKTAIVGRPSTSVQPISDIEPAAGHQGYQQPMAPEPQRNLPQVLSVSNSSSAGAPGSARYVVESWRARKGESVQAVLKRWADRQSVALMWSTAETPFLQEDFSYMGTFQDAVNHLLENVKGTDLRPEVRGREGADVKNPVYTAQPDSTIRQIRPAPNQDVMPVAGTMYPSDRTYSAAPVTSVSKDRINTYNGVQPASGADSIN